MMRIYETISATVNPGIERVERGIFAAEKAYAQRVQATWPENAQKLLMASCLNYFKKMRFV